MDNITSTVIGGAGFIGATLIRKLLDLNHRVIVIDDLSSGRLEFLPAEVEFYHCDIIRLDKLERSPLLESDYVFLLAAQFANDLSTKAPISDALTGSIGVINVFNVLEHARTLKKVVYTSSSCVYGNSSSVMKETDGLHPHETPYAIHKYLGELYSGYYSSYKNVPSVSIRVFNTYGPYEVFGPNRNVTSRFVENALLDRDITITGTGEETRDYTFVSDTADLLIAAARSSDDTNGRVYNSGTGVPTKTIELATTIKKMTNSNSLIKFTERRDWDLVENRTSDISLSKEIMNYSPSTSLHDGLEKTISWYCEWLRSKKIVRRQAG